MRRDIFNSKIIHIVGIVLVLLLSTMSNAGSVICLNLELDSASEPIVSPIPLSCQPSQGDCCPELIIQGDRQPDFPREDCSKCMDLSLPPMDLACLSDQDFQHNPILVENDLFSNQRISLFSPTFLDVMMLNHFGQRDDKLAKRMIERAGMGKLNSTFTIANLGRIDIADNVENHKLKTLFGPMAVSNAMEKYISVLTINNELHFSICFDENIISQESILKLKKIIPQIFDESSR
jgi:hypothetical protein